MKIISAYAPALAPFSIAMALLVFALIPGSVSAASTTYYIDIPNLASYGNGVGGSVSYSANGLSQNYANPNNYPNYAYQYFKNPNAIGGNSQNTGYAGGQNGSAYVPVRANFVPYDYPTYVQYVRQADGTYKLGSPKAIPAYGWNADNSLISGSSYAPLWNTGNTGNTGRGFVMTSSGF